MTSGGCKMDTGGGGGGLDRKINNTLDYLFKHSTIVLDSRH